MADISFRLSMTGMSPNTKPYVVLRHHSCRLGTIEMSCFVEMWFRVLLIVVVVMSVSGDDGTLTCYLCANCDVDAANVHVISWFVEMWFRVLLIVVVVMSVSGDDGTLTCYLCANCDVDAANVHVISCPPSGACINTTLRLVGTCLFLFLFSRHSHSSTTTCQRDSVTIIVKSNL